MSEADTIKDDDRDTAVADDRPEGPAAGSSLGPSLGGRPPGRWAQLISFLEAKELQGILYVWKHPPISHSDMKSIRSAAHYRGRGIHIRNTPTQSVVWLGRKINT